MGDLSQTPANVSLVSGNPQFGIAGAAINAGSPVYIDTTDSNKIKTAKNSGTLAQAQCDGVSINTAGVGQYVAYVKPTDVNVPPVVNMGGTLSIGQQYFVGSALGAVCAASAITTGKYVTSLGIAITTANLQVTINESGVQRA